MHTQAQDQIDTASSDIAKKEKIIKDQKEDIRTKAEIILKAEDTVNLAKKRILDLEGEIAKIHAEWRNHESMLTSSATQDR